MLRKTGSGFFIKTQKDNAIIVFNILTHWLIDVDAIKFFFAQLDASQKKSEFINNLVSLKVSPFRMKNKLKFKKLRRNYRIILHY